MLMMMMMKEWREMEKTKMMLMMIFPYVMVLATNCRPNASATSCWKLEREERLEILAASICD
jgi:hypothetical protein